MDLSSTICAIATGSVSGAVAVVRISGPRAFEVVDAVVKFRKGRALGLSAWSVKYGEVFDGGELLDQVVVSVFPAPNSYTGEDCAELCCHASPYIVSSLLELLCAAGAVVAGPGEFTQRAFVNGKMDLAQAEAVADVIAATSAAQHRLAVNQLRGGYSAEFRSLRDSLLELSALVELELDFSEEDVEFADRSKLRGLLVSALERVSALRDSYRLGNVLKSGVPVAIVGAPNSGKSTLLNALIREDRAIVSPVAGTTRDTIEESFVYEGVSYRFIDTAGLRETSDTVEAIGVERAYAAVSKAEIVIGVVDVSEPSAVSDMESLRALVSEDQHFVGVFNKCDLEDGGSRGGLDESSGGGLDSLGGLDVSYGSGLDGRGGERREYLFISAKRGEIDGVLKAISECGYANAAETVLVTGERHHSALCAAADSLSAALSSLDAAIPADLFAEDLRAAVASFNSILGDTLGFESQVDVESILGTVFSRFCIGK